MTFLQKATKNHHSRAIAGLEMVVLVQAGHTAYKNFKKKKIMSSSI
jgi:hypothetical protein